MKKSDIWNVRLFTGREYDKEIGLYYYRARYYSADLGRFISRDPIGTADNVNLYSYVGNSPVGFVDPMGREKTLLMAVDYLNVYGAYLENNPVLVGEFANIILDQDKANFKINPVFLDRAQWIDSTCTNLSDNCGKQISIGGKKIYLADLGNIGFWYLAGKYGYWIWYIDSWAYIVTAAGWDAGGKKDGVSSNEQWDRPYYRAGFDLSNSTVTWKLTRDDLLNAFLTILPNGR
ncbi:MAG: hypothetical protein ACD_71C00102G0003 [uncultured bacterium (gcode 4)]|uniref:RHS repeat-associated core domain-containing protein n=1 Tax=uncultured bacterium (gcode 4) TaxID=1234023 RepID=K1Z5Q8_9BACT|nr:MAG: hypothetical protein ACD_71C00102G0003 [uncultured bacterium (gcode 4)]